MKTLITLIAGVLFSFNSFSQTITIKRNTTTTWTETNVPKALDTLILETNSTLILKTNVNLVVGVLKMRKRFK